MPKHCHATIVEQEVPYAVRACRDGGESFFDDGGQQPQAAFDVVEQEREGARWRTLGIRRRLGRRLGRVIAASVRVVVAATEVGGGGD